jgi:hypothetical protein
MILSWVETTSLDVEVCRAPISGWSAAASSCPATAFASWADVPSVHALADGRLIAQWLEKNSPDAGAYDLRLSMSKDRGRTWTALRSPHGDRTKTQHGFASFFEGEPAGFGLVWLDGRETAQAGGAMTLRATRYESPGSGGETLVAPRVCECCPTAAAITSTARSTRSRNRTADEIRDIYIARWNGRAGAPAPVLGQVEGFGVSVNGPQGRARARGGHRGLRRPAVPDARWPVRRAAGRSLPSAH